MCTEFAYIARVVVRVSGCLLAVDAVTAQEAAGTAASEKEVVARVEEYLSAAVRGGADEARAPTSSPGRTHPRVAGVPRGLSYSSRSATTGSTRVARSAGM